MVMARSMTRNHNNRASSFQKRKNTCEEGGRVRWSDLNHDVLYSVMMRLGVEFISFSGVCKSWRSLALYNKKRFMSSRPPMAMYSNNDTWYLEDFEGRKLKTILPNSGDRSCIGVTCGYLIFFGAKTRDFWLVNPITRHQLHFPNVPFRVGRPPEKEVRAILVFSRSINGWVFVMLNRYRTQLWFSIAGKRAWKDVSTVRSVLLDIHVFKGKIYTLNFCCLLVRTHVCELRLNPVLPKLTSLNTHSLKPGFLVYDFIRSDENLYLMECPPYDGYKVHKLDFEKLNWVPCEKTREENALFCNDMRHVAAVKPESWAAPSSQFGKKFGTDKRGRGRWFSAYLWYFPHDFLNVTLIDE